MTEVSDAARAPARGCPSHTTRTRGKQFRVWEGHPLAGALVTLDPCVNACKDLPLSHLARHMPRLATCHEYVLRCKEEVP